MFMPQPEQRMTVMLPSESMQATVVRIVNRNLVVVKIGQPMMRTHPWRKDDLVAVRRTPGVLGETWQAVEERPPLPTVAAKAPAKAKAGAKKAAKK